MFIIKVQAIGLLIKGKNIMLTNKEKEEERKIQNKYPLCNHDGKHFDDNYFCVYMSKTKTNEHIKKDKYL